jgi:hypothetical protein
VDRFSLSPCEFVDLFVYSGCRPGGATHVVPGGAPRVRLKPFESACQDVEERPGKPDV